MKKIIILLSLFFISGSALANCVSYSDFMQSLKLSERQLRNIETIKNSYNVKIGALNAEIILRKMEAAQLKVNKNTYAKVNALNFEIDTIVNEISAINEQKEKEIMSNLGFIQRYKYKKYCAKCIND